MAPKKPITRHVFPALAIAGSLAVGVVACSSGTTTSTAGSGSSAPTTSAAPTTTATAATTPATSTGTAVPATKVSAAALRANLTTLFNSHVILASAATGAALAGRTDDFNAAAAELDKNSDDITAAVGSVYGDDAGKAFGPLWKKHIVFFVDYTKAVGAGDKAAADKAVTSLTNYAGDFAAFLSGANPNVPKDGLTDLVKTHVLTLKDVVDAQAAKDPVKTNAALATAIAHMHMIADPLAAGIVKQFPDMFSGDPSSKGADLQVALNSAFQQHVAFASIATGAALGGRNDEFTAAVGQLDKNSDDITAAVGSVYGDDAGKAFGPLWKKHITFFVDYTKAVGAGDKATADKTVTSLTNYAGDFAAFLSGANPNLPKDGLTDLVKTHILTLKDVVDAQAAKDPVKTYAALAVAMKHMHMIADPLAAAITTQFPEKFPS